MTINRSKNTAGGDMSHNPIFRWKYLRELILQTIPGKSFDGAREKLQIFGEIFTPEFVVISWEIKGSRVWLIFQSNLDWVTFKISIKKLNCWPKVSYKSNHLSPICKWIGNWLGNSNINIKKNHLISLDILSAFEISFSQRYAFFTCL